MGREEDERRVRRELHRMKRRKQERIRQLLTLGLLCISALIVAAAVLVLAINLIRREPVDPKTVSIPDNVTISLLTPNPYSRPQNPLEEARFPDRNPAWGRMPLSGRSVEACADRIPPKPPPGGRTRRQTPHPGSDSGGAAMPKNGNTPHHLPNRKRGRQNTPARLRLGRTPGIRRQTPARCRPAPIRGWYSSLCR